MPAPPSSDPLPEIPGGWSTRRVDVGWREFELALPAVPDKFLDDPAVLEANRRDDYMPYWSSLWPAAAPMSRVLPTAAWERGTRMLELGSGIGLVGLAALACGWDVTFSDYDELSLLLCRHNAERNGFPGAKTFWLDWRRPAGPQFPVILGCEVIYEAKLHEPVLDVIQALLAPRGCCWLADPGRSQAPRFYEQALARGFRVVVRDEAGRARPTVTRGDFQVFELTAS